MVQGQVQGLVGGSHASESSGSSGFSHEASLSEGLKDLKAAGFKRLKEVDNRGRKHIQFPSTTKSNIEVAQKMRDQGWTEANKEGALNLGMRVTYMVKGNHGIAIDAGSSYEGRGVSVHSWKPMEDVARTSLAEIEEMGR